MSKSNYLSQKLKVWGQWYTRMQPRSGEPDLCHNLARLIIFENESK